MLRNWFKTDSNVSVSPDYVESLITIFRNLLKSEKEKTRREDMRLCSADILRGQEIERNKCREELAEKIKGNEFENEIHLILTSAIIDKHRYQIVNIPDILLEIKKEVLELLKEK